MACAAIHALFAQRTGLFSIMPQFGLSLGFFGAFLLIWQVCDGAAAAAAAVQNLGWDMRVAALGSHAWRVMMEINMFDVGFWEMMLIGLVALLVFGPDKLPRVVREVTLWLRKARSVVASAKSEIDQELNLYEMRQSFERKKQRFEREVDALGSAPPRHPFNVAQPPDHSVNQPASDTDSDSGGKHESK
jgi:sec-independent protein translocase protein TatB